MKLYRATCDMCERELDVTAYPHGWVILIGTDYSEPETSRHWSFDVCADCMAPLKARVRS